MKNKNIKTNPMQASVYHCVHCGKKVERHSDKHWIKSYCEETGKNSRLILVKLEPIKDKPLTCIKKIQTILRY